MTPAMTETIARMKASSDRTIYRLPGGYWTVRGENFHTPMQAYELVAGKPKHIRDMVQRTPDWYTAWDTIRKLENAGIIHPILGQEPIGLRPRRLKEEIK